MRTLIAITTGTVAGAAFLHERHRRRGAERLGAAALESLLLAIDANDDVTGRHVRRVANYANILSHAADLDEHEQRAIERIALFHDIGKIHEALFDIIHEHTRLTPDERRAIATHPVRGAEVLAPLSPFFPELAEGVLAHHECWDGSGYPRGLRGDEIPLGARVVALADTFDAITHGRRYRARRDYDEAARSIANGRGTQFDPDLVDLMLLPPVFEELVHATHIDPGPGRGHGERREQELATRAAPDLAFRWRGTWLGVVRPRIRERVAPARDGRRQAGERRPAGRDG